jgi:hypothetical protein
VPARRQPLVARLADCARDPEVGDHRVAALEQDVLRLDVTVKDALSMRVAQSFRNLARDAERLIQRKAAVPFQSFAQRFARHVGYHVEKESVRPTGVEERQYAGVLQASGDLDLAQKAVRPNGRGDLGPQDPNRDRPVQLDVLGQVDQRHSTAT